MSKRPSRSSRTTSTSRKTSVSVAKYDLDASVERVVPTSSRELFWRAKFLRDSSALGHLPFLFWLVSCARPSRTVTLNIGTGVAHFALCQAIEKLGYDAVCQGFGVWDDAGVPDEIAQYNAAQYAEFSTIEARAPSDAIARARNVDLLLVNGPLSEDIVTIVMHDGPSRLTPTGLILFTDLDSLPTSALNKLEEWSTDATAIQFAHNTGMLLVAPGDINATHIGDLAQVDPLSAAFLGIERTFARLGAAHVNEWAVADQKTANAALKAELDALSTKTKAPTPGTEPPERVIPDAERAQIESRHQAELTARAIALEAKQKQLDAAEAAQEALKAQLADLTAAHETEQAELAELLEQDSSARIQLSQDIATLRQARDADQHRHLDDIKILTETLAATEERALQAAEEAKATQATLETEQERNAAAQTDIETLETRISESLQIADIRTREVRAIADDLSRQEAEIEALKAQTADEKEALTAEMAELKSALQSAQSLLAQKEANLSDVNTRADSLQAELTQVRLARDTEEARHMAANKEVSRLSSELAAARDALAAQQARQNQDAADHKAQSQRQEQALVTARQQIADQKVHIKNLETTIDELTQSTSWRVTAPLRQATGAVLKRK